MLCSADVWLITEFERYLAEISYLQNLLSSEEKNRADRLVVPKHRSAFIICHGFLRKILGHYLNINPAKIVLSKNAYGKPYLADDKIEFSLSHSGDMAVYAFSFEHKIGIDIEKIKPIKNYLAIAERFFSAKENAALNALPENKSELAFFHCWTRKEAFIKTLGIGLSYPLAKFSVSVDPQEQNWRLECEDRLLETQHWTLKNLTECGHKQGEVHAEYAGALAIEGNTHQICCYNLAESSLV